MILQGHSRTSISVGFVKWFGGENRKTGKTNEFGFIESIEGEDLFFHASQLDGVGPAQGDFATFSVDQKDPNKKRAIDVKICSDVETFHTSKLVEFLYDVQCFQKMIATEQYRAVLSSLINRHDNAWALEFLHEVLPRSKAATYVVGRMLNDLDQQTNLLDELGLDGFADVDDSFSFVPQRYFDQNYSKWIDWLKTKTQSERVQFFERKINDLSLSFVLACIFEGLIDDAKVLGGQTDNVSEFVQQAFQNRFVGSQKPKVGFKLLDYVREIYREKFNDFTDFSSCPAIAPFFELTKIKQKIAAKDQSFVSDVLQSERLSVEPESFVLSKLLPLIWDENNGHTVEAVFFHEVWKALLAGQLDINHPGFMNLFPACGRLGPNLSCEATYWEKGDLFYCRGHPCRDPQIIPDLNKSYLEFNMFDWLSYFGRSYERAKQPSRRDFPIKLAGYFNRLKELRGVLDCRCCGTLMKPDFKYSRVEVKIYDNETQAFRTEQFSAAYRSTVFYCDSVGCDERGNKHYLNHCLGPKCALIVDSRDLKQCDNGFYKCTCGSCCREHQREAEQRKREVEQLIHGRGIKRSKRSGPIFKF